MKYMKYLAVLVAIVGLLVIGAPVSAAPAPVTPLPAYYGVQGIEIFPGFAIGTERYGATFIAQAAGMRINSYTGPLYNGSLSTSINYLGPNPIPGGSNTINGGTWTLSVLQSGVRVGTISGRVSFGNVQWGPGVTTDKGSVTISLVVTDANGVFGGLVHHTGTFVGQDNHVSGIFLGGIQVPTIGGVLILN
jgi:hypothetical protein